MHLVDIQPIDGSDPAHNAKVIMDELLRFSPALSELPMVLVLNKLDQIPAELHNELCTHIVAELGWTGPVFRTSGLTSEGTRAVVYHLMDQIERERELEIEDPDFAEMIKARRANLEQETRENSLALQEAQRAARRAARMGIDGDDNDDDDWDDSDGAEVIYAR